MPDNEDTFDDVPTEIIPDWLALHQHGEQQGSWLYRGQSSDWPLRSSLERLCLSAHQDLTGTCLVEERILRECKRRFQHFESVLPDHDDDLEWLALAQHHGAPTRLLDWTYSVYVAAYFAVEALETDTLIGRSSRVIWQIDAKGLRLASKKQLKQAGVPEEDLLEPVTYDRRQRFARIYLSQAPSTCVLSVRAVNPYRPNRRLTIQQGIFLCPVDVARPFMKNLRGVTDYKNIVKRLLLPAGREFREQALSALYQMNITRASLFPGLDGFARMLAIYHPPIWTHVAN